MQNKIINYFLYKIWNKIYNLLKMMERVWGGIWMIPPHLF